MRTFPMINFWYSWIIHESSRRRSFQWLNIVQSWFGMPYSAGYFCQECWIYFAWQCSRRLTYIYAAGVLDPFDAASAGQHYYVHRAATLIFVIFFLIIQPRRQYWPIIDCAVHHLRPTAARTQKTLLLLLLQALAYVLQRVQRYMVPAGGGHSAPSWPII